MQGIINLDEKSIIGPDGRYYEIIGLLILKDDEKNKGKKYEVIYDVNSPLCKACIFKGLRTDFRVVDSMKGLAYIM